MIWTWPIQNWTLFVFKFSTTPKSWQTNVIVTFAYICDVVIRPIQYYIVWKMKLYLNINFCWWIGNAYKNDLIELLKWEILQIVCKFAKQKRICGIPYLFYCKQESVMLCCLILFVVEKPGVDDEEQKPLPATAGAKIVSSFTCVAVGACGDCLWSVMFFSKLSANIISAFREHYTDVRSTYTLHIYIQSNSQCQLWVLTFLYSSTYVYVFFIIRVKCHQTCFNETSLVSMFANFKGQVWVLNFTFLGYFTFP